LSAKGRSLSAWPSMSARAPNLSACLRRGASVVSLTPALSSLLSTPSCAVCEREEGGNSDEGMVSSYCGVQMQKAK
jgi:hypothetical protein